MAVEYPKIHGLTELLSRFAADRGPDVDPDELDTLDPWVIDGRYAADLPDVDDAEATSLVQIADRPCRHFGARPVPSLASTLDDMWTAAVRGHEAVCQERHNLALAWRQGTLEHKFVRAGVVIQDERRVA